MATQSFTPDTYDVQGSGTVTVIEPVNQRTQIDQAIAGVDDRFFNRFGINPNTQHVFLYISDSQFQGSNEEGQDLAVQFEEHGTVTLEVEDLSVTVALDNIDMTERYDWAPTNWTEVATFRDAVVALSPQPDGADFTVTLDDGAAPPAAPIRAAGASGAPTGTARVRVDTVPPLLLSNWDSTGLVVDFAALIRISGVPELYRDADRSGTDVPLEGELGAGAGQTVHSRFWWNGSTFRFNNNDRPVALDIGVYYGPGGAGNGQTIYLVAGDADSQTEASFDAATYVPDSRGGGWVNWGFGTTPLPATVIALLDGLSVGDRLVIASAEPPPPPPPITIRAVGSTGAPTGSAQVRLGAPPLLLSNWDPTGLVVDFAALIQVGAPPTLYADSDRGGSDVPLDGELGLGTGETVISSFWWNGVTFRFYDNDNPLSLNLGGYYAPGGPGNSQTIYLVVGDSEGQIEASFDAATHFPDSRGFSFINWGNGPTLLPATVVALLDGLSAGDRLIVASGAAPPPAAPIRAAGSTGAPTGSARVRRSIAATTVQGAGASGAPIGSARVRTVLPATTIRATGSTGAPTGTARVRSGAPGAAIQAAGASGAPAGSARVLVRPRAAIAAAGGAGAPTGAARVRVTTPSTTVRASGASGAPGGVGHVRLLVTHPRIAGIGATGAPAGAARVRLVVPEQHIQAPGSTGAPTGTGRVHAVLAPPLLLSHWDSTGLVVDFAALIVVSGMPDLYADSDRGGSDVPLDGELGLGAGQTRISRLWWNGSTFRFNSNGNPVALDLGAYYGVGGDGHGQTIYLVVGNSESQTEASFDAATYLPDSRGGSWINWGFGAVPLPADVIALLDGLSNGDRLIAGSAAPAVTPATVHGVGASGSPTGSARVRLRVPLRIRAVGASGAPTGSARVRTGTPSREIAGIGSTGAPAGSALVHLRTPSRIRGAGGTAAPQGAARVHLRVPSHVRGTGATGAPAGTARVHAGGPEAHIRSTGATPAPTGAARVRLETAGIAASGASGAPTGSARIRTASPGAAIFAAGASGVPTGAARVRLELTRIAATGASGAPTGAAHIQVPAPQRARAAGASGAPAGAGRVRFTVPISHSLWMVDVLGRELWEVEDPDTPSVGINHGSLPSGLGSPNGVAIDFAGHAWVVDASGAELWDIPDPTNPGVGTGLRLPAGLSSPRGITLDEIGHAWIVDTEGDDIWEIPDLSRPAIGINHGSTPATAPRGVAFDNDGHLWVVDLDGGRRLFEVVDPTDPGSAINRGALPAALTSPNGLTFDTDGHAWIVDTGGPEVWELLDPRSPGAGINRGAPPAGLQLPAGVFTVSRASREIAGIGSTGAPAGSAVVRFIRATTIHAAGSTMAPTGTARVRTVLATTIHAAGATPAPTGAARVGLQVPPRIRGSFATPAPTGAARVRLYIPPQIRGIGATGRPTGSARVLSAVPQHVRGAGATLAPDGRARVRVIYSARIRTAGATAGAFGTATVRFNVPLASLAVRDRTNELGETIYALLPEAEGGILPLIYSIAGLPTGLAFDASRRIVGGVPSGVPNLYAVTYTVTDASGRSLNANFTWLIVSSAVTTAPLTPSILEPPVRSGDSRESALPEDEFANSPYPRGSDVWERMTKEV